MVQPPSELRSFDSLIAIVKALRGPDGCPWDKEQTNRTLTPFAIEEAHELAEAIEASDWTETVVELGDLLLQVALHAEIGRQDARFDIGDVCEAINTKMIRRHPHVFATGVSVSGSAEVLENWQRIKAIEKIEKLEKADNSRRARQGEETVQTELAQKSEGGHLPQNAQKDQEPHQAASFDVPLALPALTRAHKIGEKTKYENFDWSSAREVLAKVDEEIAELKAAIDNYAALSSKALGSTNTGNNANDTEIAGHRLREELEAELGDVLFSVAQLARHLGFEPEQALRETNRRFERRFFHMKALADRDGRRFEDLAPDVLDAYWTQAKSAIKQIDLKD